MTDKQIIIDGVDVSECDELVKQDDNTLICEITGYLCEDRQNCYYKQLKRKEQECDELKRQRQADKGLITSTGKMNYQLLQEYDKLKTALTEIKEIAEICKCHNADGCYECKYFDDCEVEDEEIPTRDVCKLILQKISECEGNDVH